MRQGLELEPLLKAIADFLDEHEGLVRRIRGDLRRGLKNPDTGRSGLAPREVLRSLILMRVKNWDYRELRERIGDARIEQFLPLRDQRIELAHQVGGGVGHC